MENASVKSVINKYRRRTAIGRIIGFSLALLFFAPVIQSIIQTQDGGQCLTGPVCGAAMGAFYLILSIASFNKPYEALIIMSAITAMLLFSEFTFLFMATLTINELFGIVTIGLCTTLSMVLLLQSGIAARKANPIKPSTHSHEMKWYNQKSKLLFSVMMWPLFLYGVSKTELYSKKIKIRIITILLITLITVILFSSVWG